MKVALAQLNYHIGNFEENSEKIIAEIKKGSAEGADLVVFSELAICGYPPRDFLEFEDFIKKCDAAIEKIAAHCQSVSALVGAPIKNNASKGKPLFNAAYFLAEGKIQKVFKKTLLPTYDIFDEYRYFEPNTSFELLEFKGQKIAVSICEDIWNIGNENPKYVTCPLDEMNAQEADLIVNLSASPFDYQQVKMRKQILKANNLRYNTPAIYVNHVGAQTELIFDGCSLVTNKSGEVIRQLASFEEDFEIIDTEKLDNDSNGDFPEREKIAQIHDALVLGIKDYFRKLGLKKAILGLSGGIDSALTLVLAERALGKENVRAVLMPSGFSSGHSVSDSVALAENLGVQYDNINIQELFDTYLKALKPFFEGLQFDVAEENLQARTRGVLLMALSNKFGNILLNTTNKSEAAVGYGTLYGDMCGGLAVLGDVYKTEVYELSRYINQEEEIIPENIITKAPSAELRPDQKDSDSLPDYEILDKLLYQYIEKRKGPRELIEAGFEPALVKTVLRMVNTTEYKRFQSAPILRVSPKAFGMGRRMPLVGRYLS
jgi:NAD+ synthase (glutamine-hydrolysing)